MTTYVIRRLILALIVILIVSIMVFLAMNFLPSDPLLIFITKNDLQNLTVSDINILRHEFGLDKSLEMQYVDWLAGMIHGDLGNSIVYQDKVNKLVAQRLPITIYLGILSFILATVLGITAGTLAAIRRGKWIDTLMTSLANLGITVPIFWLGIMMIYFFGFTLRWLPLQGYTSPLQNFWLSTKQLIMPVFCLSVIPLASNARQSRSSLLEVIHKDYIRTAWSKGLRERNIIIKHTLKNGLIPIITLAGMHIPMIFGGSVLIETVFNIPGMGRLMVSAVIAQDLPIVRACFLILALIVVITNLLVDISYGLVDPRIRYN